MNVKFAAPLTTSLLCLLAACSSKTEPAPSPQSNVTADASRPILIDNFSMGTRLGPHGGIAKGTNATMFAPGELIYLAMELKNAPVGTSVRVVWKAQGDIVLGEETKEVLPGQRFMNFAADSSSLPLEPKYHAEVFVNGKSLAKVEFGLVMAAA
jgi:hypothetical protein